MKANFFSRILPLTIILSLVFSPMLMSGGGNKSGESTRDRLKAKAAARKPALPNVAMVDVMGTSVPENWLYAISAILKDMGDLKALMLNYEVVPKERISSIDKVAASIVPKINAYETLIWEIKTRLDGTLATHQKDLRHTPPDFREGAQRTYYLKESDPKTQVLTLTIGQNRSAPLIKHHYVFKMAYNRAARFLRDLIFYIVNPQYSGARPNKNENLLVAHNGSSKSKDLLEVKIQRIAEGLGLPIEFDSDLAQAGSSFHYPDADSSGFRRAVMISQGQVARGTPAQQAQLKRWWAVKGARYTTIAESVTDEKIEALLRGLMEGKFFKAPLPNPKAVNILVGYPIQEPSLVKQVLKLLNYKSQPIYLAPEEIERVQFYFANLRVMSQNENLTYQEALNLFLDVSIVSLDIAYRFLQDGMPSSMRVGSVSEYRTDQKVTVLGREIPNLQVRIGGMVYGLNQLETLWSQSNKDWWIGVLRTTIIDYFMKVKRLSALKLNHGLVEDYCKKFLTEAATETTEFHYLIEGLKKYRERLEGRFVFRAMQYLDQYVTTEFSNRDFARDILQPDYLTNFILKFKPGYEISGIKVSEMYGLLHVISRYLFIDETYFVAPDAVPAVPETLKFEKRKVASLPKLEKLINDTQKKLQPGVLKAGTLAYQRLFDRLRGEALSHYQAYFQREKEVARKRIFVPPVLKVRVHDSVNTSGFGDQINAKSIERMRSRMQSVIKAGKEDDFDEELFWDMMVYHFQISAHTWVGDSGQKYGDETLRKFILYNFDVFWDCYRHKHCQNDR